jgi:hypothetical protein
VVAGGPYNSGILAVGPREGATYNYRPADAAMMDKARRIAVVCARLGVDLRAAALRFVLAHRLGDPRRALDCRGGGERGPGRAAHPGRAVGRSQLPRPQLGTLVS